MTKNAISQNVLRGKTNGTNFLSETLKGKRILLVSGKTSFSLSGAKELLASTIRNESICRFSEFSNNPELNDLENGLEQFKQFNPDWIIAAGGGSVLDMAKLVNYFGSTGTSPDRFFKEKPAATPVKLKPLIAIPTTAGTGSEATHFSVLYRNQIKYSIADQSMLPPHILLIPELTYAMPPYQTACTGMDALAQGIESFWAKEATTESKNYAKKAIQLALTHLEKSVHSPNSISRTGMQEAAYWSGRAINISKTTLCHALSYSMTAHHGYPHGHAVALFLPEIFRFHQGRNAVPQQLFDLFATRSPAEWLTHFIHDIGLGLTKQLTTTQIEQIAQEVNPLRLGNNPVDPSKTELIHLVSTSLLSSTKQ